MPLPTADNLIRHLVGSPYATASTLVGQVLADAAPVAPNYQGGRLLVTAWFEGEFPDDRDEVLGADVEVVLRNDAAAFSRLVKKHHRGKLRYVVKCTASEPPDNGDFEQDDHRPDCLGCIEVLGMVERYAAVRITYNRRLGCVRVELH